MLVALTRLDADLAAAGGVLAAASTADWVSTSADLFRGQLDDARRCIATIDVKADAVRAALGRVP